MSAHKVSVVTGANKGVGYAIAKKLGLESGWHCVLTARDEKQGQAATESLLSEGAAVRYRQLDITDEASRERFAKEMEQEFGAIDVLVNNAGFAFKGSDPTPFEEQAEPTMAINFFGTVANTERLLPLVKRAAGGGRIVNVASQSGHLRIIPDEKLRAKFASAGQEGGLGHEELMTLAKQFVADVKGGTHRDAGWPNTCYGMSKLCLIAYTKILAAREPSLRINACCPGYCDTDMTGGKGSRPPAQGAETPYELAVGQLGTDTGGFFYDKAHIQW